MTRSRFSSNWWLVVYILLLLEPCAYSAPGGGTHERDVHDDAVKEATEALARAKDKVRIATSPPFRLNLLLFPMLQLPRLWHSLVLKHFHTIHHFRPAV